MILALLLLQASAKPTPWYNAVWDTKNDPGLVVIQRLVNKYHYHDPNVRLCKLLLARKNSTTAEMCELLTTLALCRDYSIGSDAEGVVPRVLAQANRNKIQASLAYALYIYLGYKGRANGMKLCPPDVGRRICDLNPENHIIARVRMNEVIWDLRWPAEKADAEGNHLLKQLTKSLPAGAWQPIYFETGWHLSGVIGFARKAEAQVLLGAFERLRDHPKVPAELRTEMVREVANLKKHMYLFTK